MRELTQEEWKDSLHRRMSGVEADIKELKTRMATSETQSAVDQVHRINVESRLSSIEDTLKWLVRVIIGAMILALVGFAMAGGLNVS